MEAVPLSDDEKCIRKQLDGVKHIVGDQIIYGPDRERGTALMFDLHNCYLAMLWREKDQRQRRISLAKGYYSGLDELGDPDPRMQEFLKLRVSTLRQRQHRAKDPKIKSQLRLALKLTLRIDRRSERLLAGVDHLCLVLHRPPAKFELRQYLKMINSTFSVVTYETGFEWLPGRKRGP